MPNASKRKSIIRLHRTPEIIWLKRGSSWTGYSMVFSTAIRATHVVEAIWPTAKPVNRTVRLYAYKIQLSHEIEDN